MSRRSSALLPLTLAATVGLFALTTFLTAQTPAPPAAPAAATPETVKRQEEANAKLFADLEQAMLRLAQRLEKSDKPEDQSRAKTIRRALELAEKESVEGQFKKMILNFGQAANPNAGDVTRWLGDDEQLARALRDILTILMTDDDTARLKEEIRRLQAFLKEAERLKKAEEIIRARTESNKGDPNKIAKDQKQLAKETKDLAESMAPGKPKDPSKSGDKAGDKNAKGGEPKDANAEAKPEAKPGDKAGEAKPDTQEAKAASKETPEGKDAADPKPGGKDGAKPGEGSAKEGPMGEESEKAGGGKGAGEPKPAEPKSGSKDPMGNAEPKPGEPGAKPSQGEGKPQGQGKGEGKPSQGKGGEAKPMGGEGSPSKSKPSPSQGSPSQGSPSQSPPSGDAQSPPPQPQDDTPGRKQIKEAYPPAQGAEEDLNKNKRPEASKKEDEAIKKIAEAIKELEKRLKQLREEEMQKLLANLEARCNNMLRMQLEVYENTKAIHAVVVKNNNQKTAAEIQKSQVQSDKEGEIVAEADKTLKMLEGEGSAVAFAGVLQEVRGDMVSVKTRLNAAYIDTDTQQIEQDIIDQLKEMIKALKKAQQDMQAGKGQPGQPGKPGNQALIDKLAELRLMRALQMQVNTRTISHARRYTGEQAKDPIIQNELRQLSERQGKIQDMLHKLATGVNQ